MQESTNVRMPRVATEAPAGMMTRATRVSVQRHTLGDTVNQVMFQFFNKKVIYCI